jgi:hypothetical protein
LRADEMLTAFLELESAIRSEIRSVRKTPSETSNISAHRM